ncbi:MAG: DUF2793 domain-containing protein [Sphingobium sp.]
MALDKSDRFSLPLLLAGQAQKEVTHNEALTVIDMLLHARAESAALSFPPGSPAMGQCWIIAAGATGAWAGHDGELACMTVGGWRFAVPSAGIQVIVADTGVTLVHDGIGWSPSNVRPDGYYVSGNRIIGARQTAIADPVGGSVTDTEARAAILQILSMLRSHGLIDI